MNQRLKTALLLLFLFLAAWVPRVLGLNVFVTIDERKWLARSANFYQAVTHADWVDTFQRGHPGVTIMWAGALGILQHYPHYYAEAPGQFTWERENFEAWLKTHSTLTPLELLAAGRWWVTLFVALAIVAGYFPLRRLLGDPLATLVTLFIAWDPFAIALSRQLHPDGFVSVLAFLTLLLFLTWLYAGRQLRYLIASGMVMGLAWLTKTPAIFLAPTGGILILIEIWRGRNTQHATRDMGYGIQNTEIRSLLVGYVLWGVLATIIFVGLWPAMVVNPVGTLGRMAGEMGEYVERHTTTNFFWGQPTDDPGIFFYPVATLLRTSPALLIGLIAAAMAAWRCWQPFEEAQRRRVALALGLFALVVMGGMTIGAKKFDRYILPIFPALDVIAVLGWLSLGHLLFQRWPTLTLSRLSLTLSPCHLVTLSTLFFLHALPGFLHYPYYLTYYNPLTGGSRIASKVLFAGWGEGMDEAARWLNQQPEAEHLRVVAWYADGPFSYLFKGQPVEIGYSSQLFWIDTDYTVIYINQWQRQLPSPEAIAYFLGQKPVYTVHAGGMDLAYIYDMRKILLPDFVDLGKESAADFGGKIRLAAYNFDKTVVKPGEQFQSTFYLQSLAKMEVNYNVLVRLVGQDGAERWRSEGWPWGAATVDWPLREIRPDGHTVVIPANTAPGLYKFVLSFYDPATLDALPVTAVKSTQPLDPGVRDVALLQVGDQPSAQQTVDPAWHFGRYFALTGLTLPPQASDGSDLRLNLQWQSLQRSPVDYTVFVHVVDGRGKTVAQVDRPPLQGFAPTRLWQPGQRLVDDYSLPLPADLPAGQYAVQVGLYTFDGGRLPVTQGDKAVGDFVVVGSFTIQ